MIYKLHLGCGPRYIPKYTHIDGRFKSIDGTVWNHIDYNDNVFTLELTGHIFKGKTKEIYTCHCLEHESRHNVQIALKRYYDILQPGGQLRISVPDFAACVQHYNNFADLEILENLLDGRQGHQYDYHYSTWDFTTLYTYLRRAGFAEILKWNWKYFYHDFCGDGYDDLASAYLPHKDQYGTLMSLNVIAHKPLLT